ncbi:MAG: hypothetical protein ACO2Z3_06540 [Flavobacteriaceae bacterium]
MIGDNMDREQIEQIKNDLIKRVLEFGWTVKDIYNIEKTLENIISKENYTLDVMANFVSDELKKEIEDAFYTFHIEHLTELIVGDLDSAKIEMNIKPVVLPEKTKEKKKVIPSKEELREQIKKDTKQL